jgi:hypothetical protein
MTDVWNVTVYIKKEDGLEKFTNIHRINSVGDDSIGNELHTWVLKK